MRLLATWFVVSILSSSAAANTWVVDDNPGPGVDFTTIAAATAIAAPGDLIIVRAGTYTGFTLSVGAVVLGESGASVSGAIHVTAVPDGPRASVANLATGAIFVESCIGGVTLEDIVARYDGVGTEPLTWWKVSDCVDVRLRGVDVDLAAHGITALSVVNARVEVGASRLVGGNGRAHDVVTNPYAPGAGGDGIALSGSADVHLTMSIVRGGVGGDLPAVNVCPSCRAGSGGLAVRVGAGSRLIISGSNSSLAAGGTGGVGPQCNLDGRPGNAIVAESTASVRATGSTITGAATRAFCGSIQATGIIGPYTIPTPPDPTLSVTGTLEASQSLTFTITGEPGASARLSFGRGMFVADAPFVVEDQLLSPVRTFELGVLPASGKASFVIPLPAYFPRGLLIVAQGTTQSSGVGTSFTPSIPITLH